VAANNARRGATVLTKEELSINEIIDLLEGVDEVSLQLRISTLKRVIEGNKRRIDMIQTQNSGVRSSSISADIAHYMMIIERDKDELAELEQKLKEVQDGT
jgi:hypothetical protein